MGETHAEQPSARNRDHKLANAIAIDRSSCPTSTPLNIQVKKPREQKKEAEEPGYFNCIN